MAVDKYVDSAQLDSDLTDIADAIREKGSTESPLAFPDGFISAVEALPSGGGITPTGTKQIEITQNGTTTEDVTNYASAEITVNVSGAYSMAMGTYTPATAVSSFNVNVPFEPQYAICFTDPYDTEQTSTWKNFLNFFSRADEFSAGMITRYLNGNYGAAEPTPAITQTTLGTYSDGVFTMPSAGNYKYLAGVTYTWFCWRINGNV